MIRRGEAQRFHINQFWKGVSNTSSEADLVKPVLGGNWSVRAIPAAVLIVLMAALLPLPGVWAQPADWVEHVDPQGRFSLRYPPQWSPLEVGALAAFAIAEPELPGQLRKSVAVANPVRVPEGTTLDQQQDAEDDFARNTFAGYTVVKREPISVGPESGSVVHYTWTLGPVRVYQLRLVLIVDGRVHGLVGTTRADSQTLDADVTLLLSIMTTYRVTPSP
jgi:hypothetical protein